MRFPRSRATSSSWVSSKECVASASNFGASFTRFGNLSISPPPYQSSDMKNWQKLTDQGFKGHLILLTGVGQGVRCCNSEGSSPYQCMDLQNSFWIRGGEMSRKQPHPIVDKIGNTTTYEGNQHVHAWNVSSLWGQRLPCEPFLFGQTCPD